LEFPAFWERFDNFGHFAFEIVKKPIPLGGIYPTCFVVPDIYLIWKKYFVLAFSNYEISIIIHNGYRTELLVFKFWYPKDIGMLQISSLGKLC
jgi:hypothetical protein